MSQFTSIEICAGAGGQALGLEKAGFDHIKLVEYESVACETLKINRPSWDVIEGDVRNFSALMIPGVDLVAGGVPCPPFSMAGKRLGADDERDLFPEALRIIDEARPRAVMLENVRGLLDPKFEDYRNQITKNLHSLGYYAEWKLLNSSDYGVSQLRPRVICVGIQKKLYNKFSWPEPFVKPPLTVGELLIDLMEENGWKKANEWKILANKIAPTLVGGSKKHGGPDLGPTRSKRAWEALSVDGHGVWNEAPGPDFEGMPRLTTRMAARVQGFPDSWQFSGKKTATYRQIGNAFPPPVSAAVGNKIYQALSAKTIFPVVSQIEKTATSSLSL